MKNFFFSFLSIITLLGYSTILYAQFPGGTFITVPAGGNYSNPLTWVGPKPPLRCNSCKIILNGRDTIDVPGIFYDHQTEVLLNPGGNLTVNQRFVMKDTSSLLLGNTPTAADTLVMQAEADLWSHSYVRLANSNDFIDATFNGVSPSDSLPTGVYGVGLFYIDGPTTFDILLSQSGYGDPGFLLDPYTINCTPGPAGNICSNGFVFGPAKSDTVNVTGPPPEHTWEFVAAAVLPVKLTKFDANLNSNQTVDISWSTSEEVNSSYFSVQRSEDGINFNEIGRVRAKGFSSITTDYGFEDPQMLIGIYFYRLQMIDLDGKYNYSRIISLSTDAKIPKVIVFNNPFTDQIRLKVNSVLPEKLRLTLTDLLGRPCLEQSFSAQVGNNFIDLQPSRTVSAGVYFLNIKSNSINKTIKLIKR